VYKDFVRIGGFAIDDCDFENVSRRIHGCIESRSRLAVFFANTHFVVTCQPLSRTIANNASVLILNDGVGLRLARNLLCKGRFAENLNGSDFIPRLLRESPRPLRLYLLGATGDSVKKAGETFRKMGQIDIAGSCDGFSLWSREAEIIAEINAAKPDILLVALGCPVQERWILGNFERLNVPLTFAVGALFDFMSGRQVRAPHWVNRAGFEWFFRLCREPRRLAYRYTVEILLFLHIVVSSAMETTHPVTGKLDPHIH